MAGEHEFRPTGKTVYGDLVGDGDVRCSRCDLNLPAEGGKILVGWGKWAGLSCDEELVRSVIDG